MNLTTANLQVIFSVTPMTIYNWRMGTDKKKVSVLPYHLHTVGTRHRIFFKWAEVRRWAIQNKVVVTNPPSKPKKAKDDK